MSAERDFLLGILAILDKQDKFLDSSDARTDEGVALTKGRIGDMRLLVGKLLGKQQAAEDAVKANAGRDPFAGLKERLLTARAIMGEVKADMAAVELTGRSIDELISLFSER